MTRKSMKSTPVNDQASILLALLANGLKRHGELSTGKRLGDRSRYVGLSDVGRAMDCLRATVADKLLRPAQPSLPASPCVDAFSDNTLTMLRRYLTLQRGHCFEELVGHALDAQALLVLRQLEIELLHQDTPIRAHLDFVLVSVTPVPTVRILECKSARRLPDALYTSHETQVYGQVGLLHAAWNTKAFTLRDATGQVLASRVTFPELCQTCLGVSLPRSPDAVDLQAWVLCLSMTDGKAFGPYMPHPAMLRLCLKTASDLWERLQACRKGQIGLDALPTASGCHALCGYCSWNADCPKFQGENQPDWEDDLQTLVALRTQKQTLEMTIQEKEAAIRTACRLAQSQDAWIQAGGYRCRITRQSGRRSLDKDRLRQELVALTGSATMTEALLSRCETRGQPSARLQVQAIHASPEAAGLPAASSFANAS